MRAHLEGAALASGVPPDVAGRLLAARPGGREIIRAPANRYGLRSGHALFRRAGSHGSTASETLAATSLVWPYLPDAPSRCGCILTLFLARGLQAASTPEHTEVDRLACGLANGEAA